MTTRSVVEIGCGAGYGTFLISEKAQNIFGLDISSDVIEYCKKTYSADNLTFQQISGDRFPFSSEFFDVCISFQVIEHIKPKEVKSWLSEIKRIMKRDALFILSTPNKKLRLLPLQKPWNPYHAKEYDYLELRNLLKDIFGVTQIYGIKGNDEIQKIEKERVKQTPVNVYLKSPLNKIVSKYRSPTKNSNELNKVELIPPEIMKKYSVNDFSFHETNFDDCLDLLCVCRG